ncbi:unnamed protein product [Paramecium pentaurelia]|uniref:E3 ubiquitin protein ligase n=1 Tax=Paramecium pentaurelia TaxID=43138 RepID=A0A8S1WV74_9CILI|nr:unnamed protein product [Paramecium pentaurelia]
MYQLKQLHLPTVPQIQENEQYAKQSFEDSVLKIQNVSLATRLDYLKKTIKEQKSIITELVERDIRHQKFFSFLEIAWRGFLQRSLRIESVVKKKGLLENKYLNAFQYLDDIFNSQYLLCNNIEGQFKKQISHKFEQFLRIIENIYFEISLEYSEFMEMIKDKTNQLLDLEEQDYLEYVKKLISTNKDLMKKNQDIEQNLKQIQKIKEKKLSDLDGQIGFQTIYQLQTLIAENKKQNETLSRRLRILMNYNDKSINQKLNEEDENYECICGGVQMKQIGFNNQLDFVRQSYDNSEDRQLQLTKLDRKNQSQNNSTYTIQQLLLKTLKSKQIKVTSIEDDQLNITFSQSEIKDLEYLLNNYQILQTQNKKYQQQVTQQQVKIKELEISNEYREDQFVESETFSILQTQNMNLIVVNSQLTQQLQTQQTQYQELANSQQFEINQMKNHYEIEIQKLTLEINQLKSLKNDQQFGIKNIYNENERYNQNLKERYDQSQKIIDAQSGENNVLKSANKELRNNLDELTKQFQELQNKQNEIEMKNVGLMARIPGELNIEQLTFRHNKHKECIQEALQIIIRHQPQFKEKFQELIGYIKTRDQRIEQFEKEISKKDKQIQDQKRHLQMMMDETDYNSKIYEEVMAKSKIIEQQLSIKEKNEAVLIQDKQAEKTKFENERIQFKEKEKQQQECINQLQQQRTNQTQLIQKYTQEKFQVNQNHGELVKQLELYKSQYEKLLSEQSTTKIERDCYAQKIQKSKLINDESLLEIDKLKQKIIELEANIESQQFLLNNPAQLEQVKGYLILKKDDTIFEQAQIQKVKTTACCSECKISLKEVIIQKCMHMLCKSCGEIAQLKESCPICKVSINLVDIWATKVQE